MTAVMSPMLRNVAMQGSMTAEAFAVRNDPFARQKNLFEAQARVRLIAWHGCEPGESTKAAIRRVVNATGLPQSRVAKLWYALPQRIDAWVLDILRAKTGYAKDAQKHLAEMRRRPSSAVPSDDQLSLGLDSLPPRRDGSVAG